MISVGRLVPALALMLGMTTATRACNWWFHQPKVPESLKEVADSKRGLCKNV